MANIDDVDAKLTSAEGDDYLRRAHGFLAKLRVAGGGPTFLKIGRAILYRRRDIDAWLAARECASTSDYGKLAKSRLAARRGG